MTNEISVCQWVWFDDEMGYIPAYTRPIKIPKGIAHIEIEDVERLSFYKNIPNFTVKYSDMLGDCDGEIQLGLMTFPRKEEDGFLQTHLMSSIKPAIVHTIENAASLQESDPNFFVLSSVVYASVSVFIVVCAFVSVVATAMISSPSPSLKLSTKQLLCNLFDWTLGYLGNILSESPHKVIQLVLLMSVSMISALYNAAYSTESLNIVSPKIYSTYKQIVQDPPACITADKNLEYQLNSSLAGNSVGKTYATLNLQINCEQGDDYITPANGRSTVVALTLLPPEMKCAMVKVMYSIINGGKNAFAVVKSMDPDAAEILQQFSIPTSEIANATHKQMFLRITSRITEAGLLMAAERFSKVTFQKVHPKNGANRKGTKKKCIETPEVDFATNDNVALVTLRTLFTTCSWCLVAGCITITLEIAYFVAFVQPKYATQVNPL